MLKSFSFFGETVYSFSLCLCVGLIVGVLLLQRAYSQFGVNAATEHKYRLTTLVVFLLFLPGAALLDALLRWQDWTWQTVLAGTIGLTYYGGLIMGILVCFVLSRLLLFQFTELINLAAPSLVLAHAVGRVGCFLGGCCYGKPTTFLTGVVYPEGSLPVLAFGQRPLHPTPLYESVFLVVLFVVLMQIKLTYRASAYLLLYGMFRFGIEFLRADPRGEVAPGFMLSPSQTVSICCVLLGLFLLGRQPENYPLKTQ